MASTPASVSRQCPHCQSSHTVKDGRSRGRQRYACHACGRTFGDNPPPPAEFPTIRLGERFHTFMADCRHPMPLRTVAQRVGVCLSTAFRWRHLLLRSLAVEELDSPTELQGRVVMLTNNVAQPGLLDVLDQAANGGHPRPTACVPEQGCGHGALGGRTLHLVEWGPQGIGEQTTLFVPSGSDDIPVEYLVADNLAPGAMLCRSDFPAVKAALRASQQVLPKKWHECFDDSPPSHQEWLVEYLGPERAARLPLDPWLRSPAERQASQAGQAVSRLFRQWMRGFRGVAVDYFAEYVCWFNASWRWIGQELAAPAEQPLFAAGAVT